MISSFFSYLVIAYGNSSDLFVACRPCLAFDFAFIEAERSTDWLTIIGGPPPLFLLLNLEKRDFSPVASLQVEKSTL